MCSSFLRFKKNDKGQSLVEFALLLFPMLLLVLGVIEFGWLFNGKIILTSAAREGARVAIVSNDEEAKDMVLLHVSGTAIKVEKKDVDIKPFSNGNIKWKQVTVGGKIDPLVGFFINEPFYMEARAEMRNEQ